MAKARITIVGLGLIGTSLGLALQKIKTDFEIIGHDKEHTQGQKAHKLGAIDRTEWNLISACEGAAVIFLALPAMAVKETVQALTPYLWSGAILTDTASTKTQILEWAQALLPADVNFIGGDPVVSHAGGIDAARANLFEGALYCLVPAISTDPEAVRVVADLVSAIGAKPYFVDATEHDGLMAAMAHLPCLMPAVMLNAVAQNNAWREEMCKLSSGDFRHATALAEINPETLRDLCLTNGPSIIRWLDACMTNLQTLRNIVATSNGVELKAFFTASHTARLELLKPAEPGPRAIEAGEFGRDSLRHMFFGASGKRKVR